MTYGHNNLGQRTSMEMDFGSQGLDSTWNYEYDSLGQLENAWKTAGGKVVPGRQYGYQFDDIGNRIKTTRGNNVSDLRLNPTPTVTSTYSPNLLNRYTQRTIPAYAEISGTANADAVLSFLNEDTSDRIRAGRNDEWFHTFMPLENNSSAAVTNSIRMTGVLPGQGTGGSDLINTNQTFSLSVGKTPEAFAHDDDGNLLSDGKFIYGWNAENRLVSVSNATSLVASYKYDHQGRRVSKTVSGITTTFIWDGNHIVCELVCSTPNSYTWGSDGHLVTASLNGTNVFYCHDGNKNATDLVNSAGAVVAHYEFDPFGNKLVGTGTLANANPFRFSNEYYDLETGHVAYMRRYYISLLGCFLNRDPIEEDGGILLYGFTFNNPVNNIDLLGLKVEVVVKLNGRWVDYETDFFFGVYGNLDYPGHFSEDKLTYNGFNERLEIRDLELIIDPDFVLTSGNPLKKCQRIKYVPHSGGLNNSSFELQYKNGVQDSTQRFPYGLLYAHERGHAQAWAELIVPHLRLWSLNRSLSDYGQLKVRYNELVNRMGYKRISGDMANAASKAWLNNPGNGWVPVSKKKDVWRWEEK